MCVCVCVLICLYLQANSTSKAAPGHRCIFNGREIFCGDDGVAIKQTLPSQHTVDVWASLVNFDHRSVFARHFMYKIWEQTLGNDVLTLDSSFPPVNNYTVANVFLQPNL